MTTIAENANRDIYTDARHNLALVVGIDETAQICKSVMETVLGECVLDLTKGQPYDQTMWTQYLPRQFEAAARVRLLTVAGVQSVVSFDIVRVGNTANYSAVIQTTRGKLTAQGVIPNV